MWGPNDHRREKEASPRPPKSLKSHTWPERRTYSLEATLAYFVLGVGCDSLQCYTYRQHYCAST
jgi:hypothetical protein